MEIKVEVSVHGKGEDVKAECPDCGRIITVFPSGQQQGTINCWNCEALLKWEVINGNPDAPMG